MGGRVVSGIAIVLRGRLATILLPLIVMGGRVVSGIAIVMGGEASYNTIAINCSQYHFFIFDHFPIFLGKSAYI